MLTSKARRTHKCAASLDVRRLSGETMKHIFSAMIILLTGCASNSGIIPLGNETFIISKQAATGFSGTGQIKAVALEEISTECQSRGMAIEIENLKESSPPYLLGNYPTVEITFRCTEEGATND